MYGYIYQKLIFKNLFLKYAVNNKKTNHKKYSYSCSISSKIYNY